uniref:replication initiation protein n=1 Tax=Helicobacter pylori TaxID=210 RepID=UPI0037C0E140
MIWLIDPVYADASGDSSNMRLLRATTNQLCELLGADAHFSHGFSRSPFYTGMIPLPTIGTISTQISSSWPH